ncbi:OmpA family protein [Cellulomonas sp. S1-8]|uniref:OmpA family protein n=1 Tax=Cellulomonas sp. S1-8 TaxID=2904790 RepID=UPI00224407A3|nr:OmpA family protein [Cellulomonas sp. S1-8]UZN02153.1 OmpA family protein [Cellulomonas sp. S1-8]
MTPELPRHGRRTRAVLVGLLVAGLVAAPSASVASTTPDELSGVVDVAGTDVATHATFSFRPGGDDSDPTVRGAVHGVQRVEGGTVLYFSLGLSDSESRGVPGSGVFGIRQAYETRAVAEVALVDRAGMTAYEPLLGGEVTYSTDKRDVSIEPGELAVVWVVFPELPAGVEHVDVQIGSTNALAAHVPVGEGALEPVVDDAAPLVGEGWPAVLQGDDLAAAEPAYSVRPLVAHRESVDEVTTLDETVEQVAATLDANVLFDKSSASLTPAAQQSLDALAADIAARGTGEVVVVGHTDSDGSDESNTVLSEQRAAAVVAALQPGSGAAVTFVAEGRGEDEPVAPNDSPENMQANRRVTVTYQVQGGAR